MGPLPQTDSTRTALLDRWNQHGVYCYHCTAAADAIPLWRKKAVGALALSVLVGWRIWPAYIVTAGCIGVLYALSLAEQQLQFQDFKHYENH